MFQNVLFFFVLFMMLAFHLYLVFVWVAVQHELNSELQLHFLCNYAFFLSLIKMNNADVFVMMLTIHFCEVKERKKNVRKMRSNMI